MYIYICICIYIYVYVYIFPLIDSYYILYTLQIITPKLNKLNKQTKKNEVVVVVTCTRNSVKQGKYI